jgi:hypothetical protein
VSPYHDSVTCGQNIACSASEVPHNAPRLMPQLWPGKAALRLPLKCVSLRFGSHRIDIQDVTATLRTLYKPYRKSSCTCLWEFRIGPYSAAGREMDVCTRISSVCGKVPEESRVEKKSVEEFSLNNLLERCLLVLCKCLKMANWRKDNIIISVNVYQHQELNKVPPSKLLRHLIVQHICMSLNKCFISRTCRTQSEFMGI